VAHTGYSGSVEAHLREEVAGLQLGKVGVAGNFGGGAWGVSVGGKTGGWLLSVFVAAAVDNGCHCDRSHCLN